MKHILKIVDRQEREVETFRELLTIFAQVPRTIAGFPFCKF